MDYNIVIISKVIYSRYKQGKFSKRDLANKTGLSLNTINNTLNGKNSTVNTLFKLMECLGMNLEDIVNEAKAQGLSFPRPGNSSNSSLNTSTDNNKTKTMADGTAMSDIAKKLGTTESEIEANLNSQIKGSPKKDIKVFQVAE